MIGSQTGVELAKSGLVRFQQGYINRPLKRQILEFPSLTCPDVLAHFPHMNLFPRVIKAANRRRDVKKKRKENVGH